MYLHDVVASLVRRWYLALAGLVLATGLVGITLALVPPTYEAKASIVLLPPKATVSTGANPYLQLANLAPTLDLLSVAMSDQQMAEEIDRLSPSADYTAKADPTSSAPILVIDVKDRSAARAQAVLNRLLMELPRQLTSLQIKLGVSSRASITTGVVAVDSQPQKIGKDQWRAAIVAGGVGLVGSALLIALWDGRRLRVRQTSEAMAPVGWSPEEDAAGAAPRRFRRMLKPRSHTSAGDEAAADWTWTDVGTQAEVAISSGRGV